MNVDRGAWQAVAMGSQKGHGQAQSALQCRPRGVLSRRSRRPRLLEAAGAQRCGSLERVQGNLVGLMLRELLGWACGSLTRQLLACCGCVCVCALKVDASEGPCCRHQLEAVGQAGEAKAFVPQAVSPTVVDACVGPAAPDRSTIIPVSAKWTRPQDPGSPPSPCPLSLSASGLLLLFSHQVVSNSS